MGKKPATTGSKMQNQPTPPPESSPDPLIAPSILKIAEPLKAGTLTAEEMAKPHPTQWPRVPPELLPFIMSFNLVKLAEALKAHPQLYWHPLVLRQVSHLRRLRAMPDEGDLEEGYSSPFQDVPPKGTRRAAAETIQKLFIAFGQGLFPHAKVEVKLPKHEGRPRKYNDWKQAALLVEFKELWDELARLTDSVAGFFRLRAYTSRAALETKLVELLQQLHRSSWRSYLTETVDSDASDNRWDAIQVNQKPLSLKVARKIARQAIRTHAISKRRLIYGLLAHYERKTLEQIRGLIERAEAQYPDLV